MRRSDMLRLNFRTKLLLALVGSVGLLLGITLVSIRFEAARQIDAAVERATEQSRAAFRRFEADWQTQLEVLSARMTDGVRTPALIQAAMESGDTQFLIDQAGYDLDLAGMTNTLTAFTDVAGQAAAALLERKALDQPGEAVPPALVDKVVRDGEPKALGYHVAAGRLFGVRVAPIDVFGEVVGTLVLGYPIGPDEAASIGGNDELCFVAGGRCIVSTAGAAASGLRSRMAETATGRRRIEWQGEPWMLIADPLSDAGSESTLTPSIARVIGVPLAAVMAPFDQIRRRAVLAGLGALAFALLLALVLSRGLSRPVRALVAATDRVRRGDFDFRVDVASRDELGMLADAFNHMTHGLLLKERYRGVLDKVVSRDIADELLRGEITLGGENREVTTLFADIRGFTALTENMEPQEVISLLNGYTTRASAAVEAEGGVVDKYVGDAVMAIFGAPISYGDDAERAVRAALRMQDGMAELNEERAAQGKAPIRIGIGINTGIAVAGNMGSANRLNYTVLGAPVNLASRLCGDAGPLEIFLSDETYERVRDHVVATSIGARSFKGFSRQIEVFRVESLRPEAVPAGGVPA